MQFHCGLYSSLLFQGFHLTYAAKAYRTKMAIDKRHFVDSHLQTPGFGSETTDSNQSQIADFQSLKQIGDRGVVVTR